MKTQTEVALNRINRAKQNRHTPPPAITDPPQIARKLDSFQVVIIKDEVNIFEILNHRDDLIRAGSSTFNLQPFDPRASAAKTLTQPQASKLSNIRTFKHSNFQTFELSNIRTFEPSNPKKLVLSSAISAPPCLKSVTHCNNQL